MTGSKGILNRFLTLLVAVLLTVSVTPGVFAQEDNSVSGDNTYLTESESLPSEEEEAAPENDNIPVDEFPSEDDSISQEPEPPIPEEEVDPETAHYSAEGGDDVPIESQPDLTVLASAASISMNTNAHNVRPGDAFTIAAAFAVTQESNAATLAYTYDGDLFEYVSYTPASGSVALDERIGDGCATIIFMIADYEAQDLGSITLQAKKDAKLRRERQTVDLAVEYVILDEEFQKLIMRSDAQVSFTTLGTGTGEPAVLGDTNDDGVVDMIDLSNIVDWFGLNRAGPDWEDWYTYFDFNNNGEIDISDIAYVARLIGASGVSDIRERLKLLIVEAESLNREDYTESSWSFLQKELSAAMEVAADEKATDEEINSAITALQDALLRLELVNPEDSGEKPDTDDKGGEGSGEGNGEGPDENGGDGPEENADENSSEESGERPGEPDGENPGGNGNSGGSSPSRSEKGGKNSRQGRDVIDQTTIYDTKVPLATLTEVHWIDHVQALSLLEQAGTASVINRSNSTTGIRAAALTVLGNRRFHQDSMQNGSVQVRVTLDNPASHQHDLLLSGSVAQERIAAVQSLFVKWYQNTIAVIALHQAGSFGGVVEVAARIDLGSTDARHLHFYSYRQATNTYREIRIADPWVDANGYLHFFTDTGDMIIVSEGELAGR